MSLLILSSFEEQESLQTSDIKTVMTEILNKNVERKEMTTDLLKQAFINYINQADPRRIYLMEQEVRPWFNMDDFELKKILNGYKKEDYSKFSELNQLIAHAILRAQADRKIDYERPYLLFNAADLALPYTFAKNLEELKERQKNDIVQFIDLEKQKFGAKKVMDKQQAVLNAYEHKQLSYEADYIFVDSDNKPLPPKYKQSLLVMHVLKALSSAIDAHTAFMTPQEAYDMKVRLEKEYRGVGIHFKDGIDGIYVDKLIPNSPASKNGTIKPDDKLIAINHQNIEHLTLKDVNERLELDQNRDVTFTFNHSGQTHDVTLKQEPLTLTEDRVDVQYEPLGHGIIGILKLDSFYDNTEGVSADKDLRDAIQLLEKIGNLKGLILDLRENHGGFVTQGVKVAGLFITNGVIVISKYNNGEEKYYRDIDGKRVFDGPLIVLVSRQTASAAEITAQALQDYGVALVVGDDHTYGKGSIQSQTVTDNSGSNYFKVTVGKYYTVSGKTPEKHGVQSDIVVPGKLQEMGYVGEGSTDPSHDQIPSAFNDNLKDVPAEAKPWFLKYYTATLQKPSDFWKKYIPQLKKNSAARIEKNKNYQLFLNKSLPDDEKEETEEEAVMSKGMKNPGLQDLQLQEAKNILKDMVLIEQSQGLKTNK